jgi:hypothetical protein
MQATHQEGFIEFDVQVLWAFVDLLPSLFGVNKSGKVRLSGVPHDKETEDDFDDVFKPTNFSQLVKELR